MQIIANLFQNGIRPQRRKHLVGLFLFIGFFGYAQLYPVQVNMNLVPPYSLKISDYHTASSDKLFVNLLLKDVSEFGRQVKLRFYVEGNGLAVRSKPFIVGANPIVLDGGVNTRLSNVDLRPYFKFENLQGLTPFQYSKALSDGVYNFCFEVYDYFSSQKISNKSCIPVYLILNDPPILNTPPKEELIAGQNPQNILFNWTPRHINATGVQYEFTIKEIWDSQIDPRAAFAISPMVYQTNTFSTTLLYGPGEPPLLEGKQYVWAVRAIVSDGISETSVFKNNGYSEVFWFRYTNNCKPPRFALAKALDASRMEISWQGLEHHRFEIQYRKKGYGDADWIRSYAYNNTTTLYNLEPKTTYEFRVGGECSLNAGFVFSNMQTFQTPSKEEVRNYSCGVLPEIEISNRDPLQNLGVNEVFTAGDFPVTVKEVRGQNGTYSGWGFITVPYLADTKIKVGFENVQINTDFQLIAGVVETDYSAEWENMEDVSDFADDVVKLGSDIVEIIAEQIQNLINIIKDKDGKLTEEESEKYKEQGGSYYDKLHEKIDNLINDGTLSSEEADKIKNTLKESEEAFDESLEASTDDSSTSDAIASSEKADEKLKEVTQAINNVTGDDTLFRLIKAIKQFDGQSFIKCKECKKINKENVKDFDSKLPNISLIFSNRKYYKCIIGYLADNGIKIEKFKYEERDKNDDISDKIKKETANYKVLLVNKEESLAIFTGKEVIECANELTFSPDYCNAPTKVTAQEKEDIINEINTCTLNSTTISNTVTFTEANNTIDYDTLKTAIENQLKQDFFQEVKIAVNLKQNSKQETLLSKGLPNTNQADITLNAEIVNNKVNISTIVSDNYLKKQVAQLQKLADSRGIMVNTTELRRQVLLDLQDAVTVSWFAELSQKLKTLVSDQVGTFIEALQASQKIVKNIWEEGKMPNSNWHSKESDHTKWPIYAQFPELVAGPSDAVIEEITGIPQAIKGIYGIMTDEEQQEAFKKLFTKDGISGLIDGIGNELEDTWNDNEKLIYFSAKTTVSVAAAIFGVGIITEGGAVASTLETLVGKMDEFTDLPKLTKFLEDVKKQDWYSEGFKQFRKQFDELLEAVPISPEKLNVLASRMSVKELREFVTKLHKLKDVEGIDKVVKDLVIDPRGWNRYKGAKFVIEYSEKLVKQGKKIKFEVGDISNDLRRVYDITVEKIVDGIPTPLKLELKNWNGFYPSTIKSQFVKDLAKMTDLGSIQWIFNKTDNIPDMKILREKVLNSLKKADGSPVDELTKNLDEDIVRKLFPKDNLITDLNYSHRLIKNLEKNEVFDKIFEIVK